MKIDQLMDAIEEIDDRYIEESAYGVRRKRNIPWGMIITAACFCMVIGAAMFMQSLGILPHLNGPGATTAQPTTTEPSDMTEPSNTTEPPETTDPVDDSAVMEEIKALFEDKNGWYYRALVDEFDSPKNLHLRYYFYNSTEFGEGLQPTKEEMDELMAWEDYQEGKTLTILPVSKMDAVLTEIFDITVAEMESTAFAGMKYVKSIDSWCFWGGGTLNVNSGSIQHVEKVAGDIYRVVYEMPHIVPELSFNPRNESYEILVKVHEDSNHILSNILIENNEQPTEPPKTRPSVEELFCDSGSWHNIALASFKSPQEIYLGSMFSRTYSGEPVMLTDFEQKALKELLDGAGAGQITRYTAEQIDEVLLLCFNKTAEELGVDLESHFTYLKETNCYYGLYWGEPGVRIENVRTEECEDGTVNLYFTYGYDRIAKLQPHETGYYILSNERYVDNTGKSEDQIAMEALFRDYTSWFNRAITCEYDSPEQIGIYSFFHSGFKGEPKITDEEWAQLKNMQGFGAPWGDIYRLPQDKMNAVLTEYFGITLEDVDPTGFNALAYLESTNCYYFKASAPNSIENFKADRVDRNSDGTIDVYYNVSYKGDYVVTIKPNGDGYRILSNRCIHSTPLVPQEPVEPTGDTELEKLFADYAKVSEKEATKTMVDAFLADPDTFVKLLAKQTRGRAILGLLSRNVTGNHPQIDAYRAAVGSMLAKELPEVERTVVYGMAVYSGLSNYIPNTPAVADYKMLLDVMDSYTFQGETAELLRKFCVEDTSGVVEVIAQYDENAQLLYIERITDTAAKEELEQIKDCMKLLAEELSKLDGEGIRDRIMCARKFVSICDSEIAMTH